MKRVEKGKILMVDVLIQTFNEALNLPHALASVAGWANRIFVVDSGSNDETAEIAARYGAEFVVKEWAGYAAQKNWALDHLPWASPWILILDADEHVTPKLQQEITEIVTKPVADVAESAFHINRMLTFLGRPIRHCGYFPSWNLRLVKRGHARYEERLVHEHMVVTGATGYLRQLLMHEDRRGVEHFIAKHNRYSTLEARELYDTREIWPGLWSFFTERRLRRRFLKHRVLPFMPMGWVGRFLYMYVFRLGFLDGRAGLSLSMFIAVYDYFIRLKYRELKRLKGVVPVGITGLSTPEGNLVGSVLPVTARAVPEDLRRAVARFEPAPVTDATPAVPSGTNGKSSRSQFNPTRLNEVPSSDRVPVSVMIPTLNEASNLPRCLDHLAWADEVVIVDSGSRDETNQIAGAYGARVVQFEWDGKWPKKKNWALRNVDFRNDWVLIVDADEWITAELADEIARAVKSDKHVGYYVNRRFIFMGGWIRHCGYYPSWNLRLIKRGHGEYERLTDIGNTGSGDNEVHEHVVATGEVAHLDHDMLHFAFPSINVFMEKHNRYSNWEAAVQFQNVHSDAPSGNSDLSARRRLKNLSRKLPFRPTLRFLYSYIWRGGFLDGQPGYVFCKLLAIYEYLSVAKYYEMCRAENDKQSARQLSTVPAREWKESAGPSRATVAPEQGAVP